MTSHGVIIATTGRPGVLHDTLKSLHRQQPRADQIVVAVCHETDVHEADAALPGVKVIAARHGLTRQRNDGVAALLPGTSFVTFLDDDVEVAPDYLLKARTFLAGHPGIVLINGRLLKNGNVTRAEAIAIVENCSGQPATQNSQESGPACANRPCYCSGQAAPAGMMDGDANFNEPEGWERQRGAYGCNMTLRRETLTQMNFDERFRLNSWLEDADFGLRCEKHGAVAAYHGCRLVHLAVTGGRVSGARMGFSQIMNPYYLYRKQLIGLGEVLLRHWLPALRNNLVKWLIRDGNVDRVGRLRGNLAAFALIVRGRCEPEYVERLR